MPTTNSTAEALSPIQREVLDRADQIFSSIGSAVSKASDLAISAGKAVASEIPDIAFQYVTYGRVYLTLMVLIGTGGMALFHFWFVRVGFANSRGIQDYDRYTWGASRIVYTGMGLVSGVLGFFMFCGNISSAVMVWTAPKMWLVLEIARLVKTIKG